MIVSVVLLAVGLLGALDASNLVSVPVPAYFAVALGTLGAGMIIASMFGGARRLIALGLALIVGLVTSAAVSAFHDRHNGFSYRPATVAEMSGVYRESVGRLTVDLSKLDLTGTHTVIVRLNVGLIRVKAPRNVDVTVSSQVDLGETSAFGRRRGGVSAGVLDVTDTGPDGPGGGTLIIDAKVNVGKVEVSR